MWQALLLLLPSFKFLMVSCCWSLLLLLTFLVLLLAVLLLLAFLLLMAFLLLYSVPAGPDVPILAGCFRKTIGCPSLIKLLEWFAKLRAT
jgi:hypothetical protein